MIADDHLAFEPRVLAARFLRQVLGAVGQHDANLLRDRVRRGRRKLARVGAMDVRRDVERRVAAAAMIADVNVADRVLVRRRRRRRRAASGSRCCSASLGAGVVRRAMGALGVWRLGRGGAARDRCRRLLLPEQQPAGDRERDHHHDQEHAIHAVGTSTAPAA